MIQNENKTVLKHDVSTYIYALYNFALKNEITVLKYYVSTYKCTIKFCNDVEGNHYAWIELSTCCTIQFCNEVENNHCDWMWYKYVHMHYTIL